MSLSIELSEVSKIFHTKQGDFKALDSINLAIGKGEIFGVIGMSGAGKSTLVRCMNGLEKPTGGKVLIDGTSLQSLNQKQLRLLRQKVGMVFQSFNLLMQRNVTDNVCFPLEIAGVKRKEAMARAVDLLEVVGMKEKKDAYPAQLSGGQKQRVAIARALAAAPGILLCDEVTSALDPETTKSILALLKEINQTMGITIVMITHEMNVVREICTHVAILEEAKLVESGTVEAVFEHPKEEATRRLLQSTTEAAQSVQGGSLWN